MRVGLRLVKIATVYMMLGLLMGLGMGISHNFTLESVHAHTLLLGWASMALTGMAYMLLPRCGDNRLASLHFWGHNVGLPAMMISLALVSFGVTAAEKAIAASSMLLLVSLGLFALNVVRNGSLAHS